MGIDKANVRFVIHHTMSKSMENYYQESGRTGRDSKEAHCILYYSPTDASRQSCMVFTEQTGLEKLYKMLAYCQDVRSCRRSLIGQHFGEQWNDAECNAMCDNCRNQSDDTSSSSLKKDLTKHAQNVLKILQNAQSISERVTMIKLLEAWHCKGSKTLRVSGVPAPDLSPVDCQRFIVHLLLGGILSEDFHFTPYSTISYIVPGLRADNVLSDKSTVKMAVVNSDFCQKSSTVSRKTPLNKRNKDKVCTNGRSSGKKTKQTGRTVEINISDDEIDGVTEQESSENMLAAKRRKLTEKSFCVSCKKSVVDID